jgi:hypothetical protein
MAIDQAQRPQFFEGQYLGAEDLTATVEYSRLLAQRHDLGAHTWGIAIGLSLVTTPTPDGSGAVTVSISPGYAWDGFGRPIVVLARYQVPADLFKSIVYGPPDAGVLPGRSYPLWLQYAEVPAQPPATGFSNCGATNQNSRVHETFQLLAGDRNLSAQRDPITVDTWVGDAAGALTQFDPSAPALTDASIPHQNFPDDNSSAIWLIPIGCVQWLPNQTPGQPGSFVQTTILPADSGPLLAAKQAFQAQNKALRQYIGVVAGAVQAPNGLIRLKDRANPPSITQSSELVWVEGDLRADGNVNLFGGVVDFKDKGGVDSNLQLQAGPSASGGVELELVIGNQSAGKNDLAIGFLDSNNKNQFTPEVVVLDNGNVGIATTNPSHKLHVNDVAGIRQNRLYISGGDIPNTNPKDVWCSLTYNAYHKSDNSGWSFPDTSRTAVTIEMDDKGGNPRFQINSTTTGASQTFSSTPLFAIDGNSGNASFSTSPTTARLTINGPLPAQGLLNFFPPDADISYDGGNDSLLWIKALNNAATAFFGGNIGIGTKNPTALLDIANVTKFGSDGSIRTPRFNVQQALNTQAPLPINVNFNSNGGSLILFVSGSGFSTAGSQAIGVQVLIDGIFRNIAQVFTNEANSHKAFTANAMWVTGVPGGVHTLTLDPMPNTITDFNDFFNVTIIELPF